MAANTKYTYQDFWMAVKKRLRTKLSAWKLSDDQIEEFMKQEETEIKNAFRSYQNGCDSLDEDACFKADVNGVAFCLEMCY